MDEGAVCSGFDSGISEEGEGMKVKELIRKLRAQDRDLDVYMFAHDHDPFFSNEGVGGVNSVSDETDENGKVFVALHA